MKTLGFGSHLVGIASAAALLSLALYPLGCAQGELNLSAGAGSEATSATGAGGGATTATTGSGGTGGAGGAGGAPATSSSTGGDTTSSTGTGDTGKDGGEPDDAGPPDSGPPDSGPPDAGPPGCTVFETSIQCMSGWTVIFVGTTGSNGGHFTYVSGDNCVSITDVNCNGTSSVGTSCPEASLGTMTVTHNPCDNSPPCTVTFPVTCPP